MSSFNMGSIPPYLTGGQSGVFDLGAAIDQGFKGYNQALEARYKPKNLAEELLAKQLQNRIAGPKAEHAEEMTQADLQLKQGDVGMIPYKQKLLQAQINKANRPAQQVLNNLEKAQLGYDRAVQSGDPVKIQQAKDYAMRIAQGSNGIQFGVDPETGAISFSQGGFGGNKGGQQIVTDKEGNSYAVNKPTAAVSTATQKASSAEVGRGLLAKNAEMPYLGTGSNFDIIKDRADYSVKGDKAAGDRLVKAAVAAMLVPEYAGTQLAAQNIPATVPALEHQSQVITQGWPGSYKQIVDNLPPELQKQAKEEHAAILKKIKEAKEANAVKGYPVKIKNAMNKKDNKSPVIKYVRENGKIVRAS